MLLVFILLGIISIILLLLFLILISTLKVEIQDLKLSNMENDKKASYIIKISKIPKIDIKTIENDFKLEDIKTLKKLHLKISKLKLNAILGLESPVTTAFLIAILSSGISIAIPHLIKKWDKESYKYNIQPIYNNQNLYKISLNCIIELKVVHIINVIYILVKKGKRDKNERTTSNRKPYAYSNE